MRNKIKYYLQNSEFISLLYYYIGSLVVNIISLFVKPKEKTVLFVSFGGRQYSDSPKAIFEWMRNDPRFKDWEFTWAFIKPNNYQIDGAKKVKIDSLSYFITAIKSRVWVTNSGIKRYLNFHGKNTLFINTWHGTPIKKIGIDEVGVHKSKVFARKWFEFKDANITLAESKYDAEIFKRIFDIDDNQIMITGLPRNDELYHNKYDIDNIKKKLNIPKDKKVILYAPTVRGNNVDEDFRNFINPSIDFNNWKRILGEYVILFRAHYFVDKIDEIKGINLDNVINVTSYENLNELMVVSDLLISDYSSIFFDYAILEKPMFCFAYDYDEYIKYQGLYLDINKEIPNGIIRTEKELLYMIKNLDYSEQVKKTIQFKKKYLSGNGKATQQVVDYIFNNTKNS